MKEELSPVGVWGKSRPGRRNGWSRVREGKAIGDKVREREWDPDCVGCQRPT